MPHYRLFLPIALLLLGSLHLLLAWPVGTEHSNGLPLWPSTASYHQLRSTPDDARPPKADNPWVAQMLHPQGIMAILLLAGADVIQKAIAQGIGRRAGKWPPPLVAFSFGWVSYAVGAAVMALCDAASLPAPDYDGYVVTVDSGDHRANQSWMIGRLLRGLELEMEETVDGNERDTALMVVIFMASPSGLNKKHGMFRPRNIPLFFWFCLTVLSQIFVAAIPWLWVGSKTPYVFAITMLGIGMAIGGSMIPSMDMAKYPPREASTHTYAITRGNGQKYAFIIMPDPRAIQADDFKPTLLSSLPHLEDIATGVTRADGRFRFLTVFLTLLWMLLLLSAAGLNNDTEYLLLIGLMGMAYNIFVATRRSTPEEHGIPLIPFTTKPSTSTQKKNSHIIGLKTGESAPKVVDVLHELEDHVPGAGISLLPIFFPGHLRGDEKAEWAKHETTAQSRLQQKQTEWREASAQDAVGSRHAA